MCIYIMGASHSSEPDVHVPDAEEPDIEQEVEEEEELEDEDDDIRWLWPFI